MCVVKNVRQFHPDAGKLVDIEKATVVDVVGGHAEIRGTPVLKLYEFVERLPAIFIARDARKPGERRRDGSANLRRGRRLRKFVLQLAGAARNLRTPLGKVCEIVTQACEPGLGF